MSISIRAAVAGLIVAVAVTVGVPEASAEPVQDQQCQDETWAKLHPRICYKYTGGPFGIGGGGGGGGGDRGILGRILDRIPGVGGLL